MYVAGVLGQRRVLGQRHRREVEQPGRYHTAPPPHLRDVRQVQVVAIVLVKLLGGRVAENVEALGVSLHQPVFDAVVNHLHEVPRARGPAVKITFLGRSAEFFPPRSAGNAAEPGSERLENWVEALDHVLFAADHHAVSALESPNAAAGPDVDVVNAFLADSFRPPHVVFVERIAAVNDGVARSHQLGNRRDHLLGRVARGHHHPNRTGLTQLADKVFEGICACSSLGDQLADAGGIPSVNEALLPPSEQTPHHVSAHSSQTHHSELHGSPPLKKSKSQQSKVQSVQQVGFWLALGFQLFDCRLSTFDFNNDSI